jgi:hydrogenase maturation protein HypF
MKIERARALVRGAVQGVGFRPFVYRLARELGLAGWVSNSAQGVVIEIEGAGDSVRQFLVRLDRESSPRSIIQSHEFSFLDPAGYEDFVIRPSEVAGAKTALILPDIAPCADCLRDVFDSGNRRHCYPFTNCTNCGPRFTIIEELPYDRPNTSMKKFPMCLECEREYHDPADRRFHAQPNACPRCGPHLEFWDGIGAALALHDEALLRAAAAIRAGKIVALKGVGGFQLIADARDDEIVRQLRQRKHRSEKPFALMYPTLESAQRVCRISDLEERLLLSAEAPIVLLQRRGNFSGKNAPAASVAPGNPNLGVMLPSTPLHHLLLRKLGFPVVATSGNLSDEPICTDEREALRRLAGIADFFLVHDRPIVRPVDDSVVRVVWGREMILRRARGYAPLPVTIPAGGPCVLALGAHLKNTVALSVSGSAFVSQHIGDLETAEAHAAFRAAAADLPRLYEVTPEIIACDLHPDYLSTRHAVKMTAPSGAKRHEVQHHWAHVLSCMAENEVEFPALGVAWDGTGYGTDGTIWGGEFLLARDGSFERVAHFRSFRLPGGEAAIRQPRRTALGLLFEIGGAKILGRTDLAPVSAFSFGEVNLIRQMLTNGVQSPVTSSAGRLFDAVAAIIGLRQNVTFEGQAAMELEFAVQPGVEGAYDFCIREGLIDWQPMVEAILRDLEISALPGIIAAKFHHALAAIIVEVARQVGEPKVVLSGGCFQNRYLTEITVQRLLDAGFHPYWHQRIPPNDGGIALGQVVDAHIRARTAARKESKEAVTA